MFVLLTCTQFHLLFWMGRTLPNMYALLPGMCNIPRSRRLCLDPPSFAANVALYLLIDRAPNSTRPSKSSVHWAISLLTFAAVVFRSELLLLLGLLVAQAVLRYTTLYDIIKVGLLSGTLSAGRSQFIPTTRPASDAVSALTVLVDSYFWQQWPLWPELYGIYFNVFQGKSAEWGVRAS